MNVYAESWKGKASLAMAFWVVYFITFLILGMILNFIIVLAVPNILPTFKQDLVLTFLFPYTLFAFICVWRCGKNSWIGWSILSKILVSLAVISGIYAMVVVFK